ncbi:MAG: hypothetical protein BWY09_01773 [Candidatus Hydrogenedentes bacterium ADurb.Bin179]|nr:MAG: hypothetical protein BWY09_01773 [Candidatus Hydrogenedentes bacterium ADurb.Bin179]
MPQTMKVHAFAAVVFLVEVNPGLFALAGYRLSCETRVNQITVEDTNHAPGNVKQGAGRQCPGKLRRMPQEPFFQVGNINP